jgi:hypothetical protein
VNRHVQETAVLLHVRLRRVLDRLRQLALVEDSERAVALGDEQPPVGQKLETERRVHVAREDFDLERLLFRCDDLTFRIRNVRRSRFQVGRGRSDVRDQLEDLLVGELLRQEADHAFFRNTSADRRRDLRVVRTVEPFLIEEPRRASGQVGCAVTSGTHGGEEHRAGVVATAAASSSARSGLSSLSGRRRARGRLTCRRRRLLLRLRGLQEQGRPEGEAHPCISNKGANRHGGPR